MEVGVTTSRRTVHMNCWDRCELALEGVTATMVIHAMLDLEGEVDPARLSRAISSAQKAHPVLCTVVRTKWLRTSREIREGLPQELLTVRDAADSPGADYDALLFEWMNRPIDVREGYPFRVLLLRKSPMESSLVFTFHHSATDGLRALTFMRKVVEDYNDEASGDMEVAEDIRMSRRKDELLEMARSQRPRVEHYYLKMVYALFHRLVLDAFPPPARVFHDRSGRSPAIRLQNRTISPEEVRRIESWAASLGAELNDVLLAACCRAVEKWNSRHGRASNMIRLMVPVNVSPKGYRHVLSNQLSWLSPSTSPADRADPVRLVKKLRSFTIDATVNRTAFSLIYLFYFGSRLPIPVMRLFGRLLLSSRTYVDTVLTTNIGVVWPKVGSEEPAVTRIGSARIVNFTGSGPVASQMGLTLGASIYNRILNIAITYRDAMFSREKAGQLLDLYVREILEYPAAANAAK